MPIQDGMTFPDEPRVRPLASALPSRYVGAVQHAQTGQGAGPTGPAHVIRYVVSFDDSLEAGRLFHARLIRWYQVALAVGLVAGIAVTLSYPVLGLWIALTCATLFLLARFSVMDRLFGRRRLKSLIGGMTELDLGEDGIDYTGPLSSSHIPWASITEVRSNRRTVLFVCDRLLLAYAPAASFASPAEMAEAIAYSRRQIAAARVTSPTLSSEPVPSRVE